MRCGRMQKKRRGSLFAMLRYSSAKSRRNVGQPCAVKTQEHMKDNSTRLLMTATLRHPQQMKAIEEAETTRNLLT